MTVFQKNVAFMAGSAPALEHGACRDPHGMPADARGSGIMSRNVRLGLRVTWGPPWLLRVAGVPGSLGSGVVVLTVEPAVGRRVFWCEAGLPAFSRRLLCLGEGWGESGGWLGAVRTAAVCAQPSRPVHLVYSCSFFLFF